MAITSPPSARAQQEVQGETGFRIAGTVVNARTGAPLSRVRVAIFDTTDPAKRGSLLTTEDGRFSFASLPPGKYALQGEKNGFIPSAYQQHEEFSTAIVTGPTFKTENLVLRMTPFAALSGKIFDESGEPVRKASVTVYRETLRTGIRRVIAMGGDTTDDQGYYEFAALMSGKYFVSVSAQPWYALPNYSGLTETDSSRSVAQLLEVAYPITYNDGGSDSQSASPITLQSGDHAQADIHLSPVLLIHITFHTPEGAEPSYFAAVFQKREFDHVTFLPNAGIQPRGNGVYELTGIPAGKYAVRIQNLQSGTAITTEEVNLSKDGELDLSQAPLTVEVKVSVQLSKRGPPPKDLQLGLQNVLGQMVAFAAVDRSGDAAFQGVPPGEYSVVAFSSNMRYSVRSTKASGDESAGHHLVVKPGAALSAAVQLAGGLVSVEGFAKRGETPLPGVMVALIPNDPQNHLEDFRRDQSDSDGSFVVRGVVPGRYTLIAVQDAWEFPWQEPEALKRYLLHGQELTIGELMTNAVHLPEAIQVQPR